MSGFFEDKAFKNESGDQPWKKSETDRFLDAYLEGASPDQLARQFNRTPKSISRRIQVFQDNEFHKAERYEPKSRKSRSGKRFTPNEVLIIKSHKKRGVPLQATATVLQRPLADFGTSEDTREEVYEMRRLGTGVDLVLAYRYLYYVQGISIVSDKDYDDLEAEEIEFGKGGAVLKQQVGSDRAEDYQPHIRALAMYLAFKYGGGKKA